MPHPKSSPPRFRYSLKVHSALCDGHKGNEVREREKKVGSCGLSLSYVQASNYLWIGVAGVNSQSSGSASACFKA